VEKTLNLVIQSCEVFLHKAFFRPGKENKLYFFAFNMTLLQKQKKKEYRMAELNLVDASFTLVEGFEFKDVDRIHSFLKDAQFY